MNKLRNIGIIAIMIILFVNTAIAVSDIVKDSTLTELEVEEDKREYLLEIAQRVSKITKSKAYIEMGEEEPENQRALNLKIAANVARMQTTTFDSVIAGFDDLEEEYGIKHRTELLSTRNMSVGGVVVIILLLMYSGIRKATKKSKFLANAKLPSLYKNEKKKAENIRELLIKKEPLIKENSEISRQLAGEVEFFKELKELLVKKSKHFRDFKNWGALLNIKGLTEGDKDIIKNVLAEENPSITVNGEVFRGMEIYKQLNALDERGVASQRLLKNHEELGKINDQIVKLTKILMTFERKYDRACKTLEIKLEDEETELESFYKKFIKWNKREVEVDVEATKANIDEHLRRLNADKNRGMKEFAEEAKKSIQTYHYKQQLINAIERKVKVDLGKGVREFEGEKENIQINDKILEKIPGKLGHGKYDELKQDMAELILNSNNISGLYKKWELIVVKALFDELKIQDQFNKSSQGRVNEVGGADNLAKKIAKKVPGLYGKEKEIDKIANDVKKYTKTFGARRRDWSSGQQVLRDQENLKKKLPYIIIEEITKSKKKINLNNIGYLQDKIASFMRGEGLRIFSESEIFRNKTGEARKFAEELINVIAEKINEIKGQLK